MVVTSHDVARAAGVSQPTVSRALRNDPSIASKTRQKVKETAELLGYVPSELGRSLSAKKTRRIAIVADLDNPLWPMLIEQLHDVLSERGYSMTLLAEHGDVSVLDRQLLGGWADGVIITSARLDAKLPGELLRRGIPFVLVNRTIDDLVADAAVADNVEGGRQAAQILVTAGHKRFGALFGPTDTSTGRDREHGFRSGLADAGFALPPTRVVHGAFDQAFGLRALPELLRGRHRATAVFCANDVIAIGAMNTAHRLGVRVPEDLALMGFDDLEQSSWPMFDLTTIHVPFDALVRSAVERLLLRVAGEESPAEVVSHRVEPVLRSTHLR